MTKSEKILEIHKRLKSDRMPYEREWQDVRELVRPYGKDFMRMRSPSDPMVNQIFDSTAPEALEGMAAGLHTFLTNPVERWINFSTLDGTKDPEELKWLEIAAEAVYSVYSDERSRFNQSIHECFLDLGGFGNCHLYQDWNEDKDTIRFKALAPASCWFTENCDGEVDTVHREFEWTWAQIVEKFGVSKLSAEEVRQSQDQPNQKQKIIHRIAPSKEAGYDNKFESVYLLEKSETILRESGYQSMPIHTSRWVTLSEEVYGRSPATKVMPDIRMLNQMEKTIIKAAQKACDPPLVVENDSVLLPLDTAPASLIWKEEGREFPQTLPGPTDIHISLEQSQQKRQAIRAAFFADWFELEKITKEMTATEVMDRQETKLRLIAPLLGRQQSELLGPTVKRTFEMLYVRRKIPPMPKSLLDRQLVIVYISPAAKAQTGVKALQMQRYIQTLIPLLPIAPNVMDKVDMDKYAEELAQAQGVTRSIFRTDEQVAAIREQRAKTQQLQQAADIAKPASEAIRNISQARAGGLDLGQLIGAN